MMPNSNESDDRERGERGRLPPLTTSGQKWVAPVVRPRVALGPLQTASATASATASEAETPTEPEVVQDASAELEWAALVEAEGSVEVAPDAGVESELDPTLDAQFESLTESAGWEGDKLPFPLTDSGVHVEFADEGALTESVEFEARAEEGWSGQSEPLEAAESAGAFTTDPERVAEIAGRLERIARTLRQQGAMAALAQHADDPLGAMVTGYLLGFSESVRRAPYPADSGADANDSPAAAGLPPPTSHSADEG